MLENRFHAREIITYHVPGEVCPTNAARSGRYGLVSGHLPYTLVDSFNQRPFVLTFLRQPVQRAISKYHFLRHFSDEYLTLVERQTERAGLRKIKVLSLSEFIRSEPDTALRTFGNSQTDQLTRDNLFGPSKRRLTTSDLELAKKNLILCDCIGLTEDVRKSMDLLCYQLGWPRFEQILRANVTEPSEGACVDSEAIDMIREMTTLDQELYELGKQLFNYRWKEATDRISPRALEEFVADFSASENLVELAKEPLDFTFDRPLRGFGWHLREHQRGVWCRWTGPGNESWLDLPFKATASAELICSIPAAAGEKVLMSLQLFVNDHAIDRQISQADGGFVMRAVMPEHICEPARLRIGFKVDETLKPCDEYPGNMETRHLGILMGPIVLKPLCKY